MTLDTRWEDVDALLTRSPRTKVEQLAGAVAEIAAMRFNYPTPEHASYRTHTNVPEETMLVQVGEEKIAPDIVVVERLNTGDTRLVMTAAVATHEMVNDGEAKRTWARLASIPDQAFYLYVPVGYGQAAKKICGRLKIEYAGVRTWRWTPRGFEINDVSEPMNPFAALMPGFVRKAMAAR
jgi:hypothetical protein